MAATGRHLSALFCLFLWGCVACAGASSDPAPGPGASNSESEFVVPETTARVEGSGCTPTILILEARDGIEIRVPTGGVIVRPGLIGCAEVLGFLAEGDLAVARDTLTAEIETDITDAGIRRTELSYRRHLAELVNEALHREVATEVSLTDFFLWESRRRAPGHGK